MRHFMLIAALLLLASCGGDDTNDRGPVYVYDGDTTDGDVTDGDIADADITDGDITDGDEPTDGDEEPSDGDVVDGDTSDGDATDGDVTDGDVTDGDVTDGDVSDGDVIDGDVTDGDVTDGDVTDGDATDGDVTDGDTTDGDIDCYELAGCPNDMVCNLALGRCEIRSTFIDTISSLTTFHPPAAAGGDLLAIDGARFFYSMVGNFQVKVFIGGQQLTFTDYVAWDENRMLVRVPEGASGLVGVQCEGGFFANSIVELGVQPQGVASCDDSTPVASGMAATGHTILGPYAPGHVDRQNNPIRYYYPAECGSLRRPGVPGSYPLIAILHGNGAGHVNYEYLGQLLASRGFVVINPPSTHTNEYDPDVIRLLHDVIAEVHGTDLSGIHPSLEGISTNGEIGFICHSRGCGRQQEMFGDFPSLAGDTQASVFLGPANREEVVPGYFLAIGATEDGQSFPWNYNAQYDRQPSPKWKVIIQGGNHSLFADAKIYYGFDGVPQVTRQRQLEIVASFAIPLIERAFDKPESGPEWLDNPPQNPDYVFESAP